MYRIRHIALVVLGLLLTSEAAADCFTPDQRLLFGGGLMTVEAALQTQQSTVVVLAAGSTVAQPVYEEAAITQFYSHLFRGGIVRIETYDGHCLRVTKSHTVLTAEGELIAAGQVQPEMTLMGDMGPTRVRQTWQSPYEGIVWHIGADDAAGAPAILIAEQLLTGSLRSQPRLNQAEHDKT